MYRRLLDSTGEGIYAIDRQGSVTYVNRIGAEMLRSRPETLIGQNGHALIHHSRPDSTPYPEDQCPIFQVLGSGQRIHVEDDVFWRPDGTSFPVSYTAAPIHGGNQIIGVVVVFSNIRKRKAAEQMLEDAFVREFTIAQQLQAALLPEILTQAPGLSLASYYQPALTTEAGVGGDFTDVFQSGPDQTFMIVGDVSGKGLAAAVQVATIKYSLRFALYNGRTVSGPVITLNRTLADHDLLTGFATLFVGRYDAQEQTLTYVNCGQDEGLVLRAATGKVELLPPTGPILGAFSHVTFTERAVHLDRGDVLAVYTDGLSEAGTDRAAMLTAEGVAALLAQQAGRQNAREIASRLIAGVNAYAGPDGIRDDQCLLVAVRHDPPEAPNPATQSRRIHSGP